jgi:cyclohexanone monooxygenase
MEYSYSFSEELEQEWEWTERFPAQPEILSYLDHVADRFELRPHFRFDARVVSATWDDAHSYWVVRTRDGERSTARFVIMASGCLSAAKVPDVPGAETFAGASLHTSNWPAERVDFTGMRVGVIGTGSSGVQAIPLIAQEAAHTFVFQRTPNFCMPARNRRLEPNEVADAKADLARRRDYARRSASGTLRVTMQDSAVEASPALREERYERGWKLGGTGIVASFSDLSVDKAANDTLAEFLRDKIRSIVEDPHTADLLTAQDYPVGAKRLCLGTDYYETFNRTNVSLVDLRSEPIDRITPTGITTTARSYELDAIVFATGFDAMTGSILAVDIRGRGGVSLRDEWSAGPHTYLGVACAGFPNLFLITGPGSPSVLSNVVTSIEQHVEWIGDYMEFLLALGGDVATEPTREAQDAWVAHVNEVAELTLLPRAASWYLGANVPGKPRVFMPYVGGVGAYRERCTEIAAAGYPGFKHGAS